MRPPLSDIAAAQYGAFSYTQARTSYTRAEVRARIASGRWLRVFAGALRSADAEPTQRLLLTAAGLSVGREVPGCLATAAALHGFDVTTDRVTHIAVPGEAPCRRRSDLRPHQLVLRHDDLVRLDCGSVVTGAERTAIDLARTLRRGDALATLDAALTAGACTSDSLARELVRHTGLRGVLQARELLQHARPGPEAPPESWLRLRVIDAGLPSPTVQLPVHDTWGIARRWLDMGWDDVMVGLEYDGREAHSGEDRLRSDRRRHNWLQDLGRRMFYATDEDLRNPARLLTHLRSALRRTTPSVDQGAMVVRKAM